MFLNTHSKYTSQKPYSFNILYHNHLFKFFQTQDFQALHILKAIKNYCILGATFQTEPEEKTVKLNKLSLMSFQTFMMLTCLLDTKGDILQKSNVHLFL